MTHLIDITERKETEQKLLEVQDSYNLISENARDIIYFSTPDGVCRYISPSVTDLLGYKPEELIGKTNFQHYHPDDIAGLIVREPSEEEALTYRLRHMDGRYLWFETTFRLIRSELGEVEKVFAIGRDVTERKKHEDSLAEAQRIAQLGSWEWDVPVNEVTYSEEVYRMHGMEPRKSITQPVELLSLVHPSDQGALLEAFSQAFEGKPISLEYRHVDTEDGESVKYFHIRGAITRDKSGVVVRMNGTIQDVTERKLVEFRLQETIERYNSLKKYNHDAVFSLDLNGNFLNSNKMATRLTGYSPQEMAGMPYSQIFETNKSFSLHDGETDNWESELNRIRHQDGHTTEILTTIAPIIISGKTIGYYIIAKDITEQKKLLIEKETAERTNKAKSNFFAMMSHEIRTPMNGVIGMADLLMETSLDAEQQEYISVIRRSGESLINIINDILDFSKIEFGHTKLAMEPFEIRQCLAETMTLLSPLAKKKDLRMEVTVKLHGSGGLISF
jgi:PAS domain S-box-containing protein